MGYTQTSPPTSITDSYGRTLTIAYNGNGLISSVTTPDGLVLSYTYNSNYYYLLVAVSYSTSPATS